MKGWFKVSDFYFDAIIFDMDGVVTKTALVHAHAWKKTFDEYMKRREEEHGEPFTEFTHDGDYLPYVDGKPRYEGVQSFLESRGIELPYGEKSDPGNKETICGIGNRKNELFREVLEEDGVERYEPMVEFIKEVKQHGVKVGVASSSKNCEMILEKAGVLDLFETRVDGVVSETLGLKGKPEADIFVTAARNVGAEPARTIVVEDATSGVAAGRNGGFGLVLGVARKDNVDALLANGADIVMKDLSDMRIGWLQKWFQRKPHHLIDKWNAIDNPSSVQLWEFREDVPIYLNPCYLRTGKDIFEKDKTVFFLDYDGTLTPIVDRPQDAVVSGEMKDTVERLSKKCRVFIVSGRFREDVQQLLGIKELLYAGSHGFDIEGEGFSMVHPKAKEVIPVVEENIKKLEAELGDIDGLLIEKKKFSVAVHYRLVDEDKHLPRIRKMVEDIARENDSLRLMSGKKVFELLPNIEWDKGKAIRWILEAMKMDWHDANMIYIGDDVTDEFAFRMLRTRGTSILVSKEEKASSADFRLKDPQEVRELFEKFIHEIG
ncbi:MAG: trehalose-phosphatase [Candidatus Omnitrophica bacterium]|nr:trehalose-phosphatase [Candidatus Omnitrophota bacterium]